MCRVKHFYCPQSFCSQGGLCLMSLHVWLPGPVFLRGDLCLWSHVLSKGSLSLVPCSFQGVSVCGPVFPLGGSLDRESVNRGPPGRRPPEQRSLWTCTPRQRPPDRDSLIGTQCVVGSGQWAVRILLECILVTCMIKSKLFKGW